MADDQNQILIPQSFIDLFAPPGRPIPRRDWQELAARYEMCEDMAQLLTETARQKLFELGIAEEDVLQRMAYGLRAAGQFSVDEAVWVVTRLAELLGWPAPLLPGDEPAAD